MRDLSLHELEQGIIEGVFTCRMLPSLFHEIERCYDVPDNELSLLPKLIAYACKERPEAKLISTLMHLQKPVNRLTLVFKLPVSYNAFQEDQRLYGY